VQIVTSDKARRQLEKEDEWWSRNRDSPDLFADDFEQALSHLKAAPDSGQQYCHVRGRLIRRWLMKKSRHHVYYWHDRTTDVLNILAVWSATRGHGPPL
jgi:hypothetical protein